jgi:predicted RNA-binding protein with PIN domain
MAPPKAGLVGVARGLIVDGYNVMYASPVYRRLLDRDADVARSRLVDDLAARSGPDHPVTVVFDGGGSDGEEAWTEAGGVRCVFTAAGVTADTVIERLAREARGERLEVAVVTSDATTQWTVLGGGITRISARELIEDIAAERGERAAEYRRGPRASKLDERVSDETLSGLLRMRDGQERTDPPDR